MPAHRLQYFRCSALALEPAVHVLEVADAQSFQTPGLGLEVAEAGCALRCNDQDDPIVSRQRQVPVAVEESLALQPLPDLALLGLQITEGVIGIDGLRRPLDNSTNGRDFGPMVRPGARHPTVISTLR